MPDIRTSAMLGCCAKRSAAICFLSRKRTGKDPDGLTALVQMGFNLETYRQKPSSMKLDSGSPSAPRRFVSCQYCLGRPGLIGRLLGDPE